MVSAATKRHNLLLAPSEEIRERYSKEMGGSAKSSFELKIVSAI